MAITETVIDLTVKDDDRDSSAVKDALLQSLLTISQDRLRTILVDLCERDVSVRDALASKLVTSAPGTGTGTGYKRKKTAAAVKWVTCANCDEEYDAGSERKSASASEDDSESDEDPECQYHPGEMECDYNSDVWDDWDEDCHGPMDRASNRREYPEGFTWSCCDESGDSQGCETGTHVPRSSKQARRY